MESTKFQIFIFALFFAGYFIYLNGFYSFESALLMAVVTVILIYSIPLELVKVAEKKWHALTVGILLATM